VHVISVARIHVPNSRHDVGMICVGNTAAMADMVHNNIKCC
jgi:hypothetical protein